MRLPRPTTVALISGLMGIGLVGHSGYLYAKAVLAQYLLASAWERTLQGEALVRPWSWADTWPVARLQAPRLVEDLIVLAGDSGRTLAFGPGMREDPTQQLRLISAHRDTHFQFLAKLRLGDALILQSSDGKWQRYEVRQTLIVDTNQGPIMMAKEGPLLVLSTCYPFDTPITGGSQRFLVVAEPIGDQAMT
jgi:sortase A